MYEDICYQSATQLARRIRNKELSPVEVVEAHLERIQAINPRLNAIVTLAEDALDRAREAEKALGKGGRLGALHGVPYTLKDCIEVAGIRTTQGSKLFENYVSKEDATVQKRLKKAGGILLGKTNLPEFALWWETGNLVFGPTNNPWNLKLTPGGSSGGEAAAIATGLSALGIGTDLGGSIREPSSFCGLVGIKPTLGRVAFTGILPQVLLRATHAGPIARRVEDLALALNIIAGPDGLDIYAPPVPVDDYVKALDSPLPKLKVGWSPTGGIPVLPEVQEVVKQAAEALSDLGLDVEPVEIPGLKEKDAGWISSIIYVAEGSLYLSDIVEGRQQDLTETLRTRYIESDPKPFGDYLKASFMWEDLRREVAQYFTRYDLFLCPTIPMPAFPQGQMGFNIDGQELHPRHALRGTVPWDLTGSPAVNVPFGWSKEGLPIGVQLVGRHFAEALVLRAAKALQDYRGEERHPPVD